MAKSEGIDILALYTQGNYVQWNTYLTAALKKQDVNGLVDVLRRLQIGMDNLVEQRLNTDQIVNLFLRLQRSIENTLRDIHKAKMAGRPNERRLALEQFLKGARY